MINAPTITVLMPAYNAGRYIAQAVKSVLDQSYVDFELLVIDDGSTDDTQMIMMQFTDARVRFVHHDSNRGLVAVLNDGLDLAKGHFIARMDADDIMLADRLQKQVRFLEEHPQIAAVGGFVELINADDEVTGTWSSDRKTVTEQEIRTMMPRTNPLAHGTMMIRRSALGTLRYAGMHEDWDLWMRMLARGLRISKIPEPLVQLRIHPSSYMGGMRRARSLEQRLIHSRKEYLWNEWRRGRFDAFQLRVIAAQWRTRAGMLLRKRLPEHARDTYRALTYSPFKLVAEQRRLKEALATWQGRHAFVFSYLGTGGAEQVHSDIITAIADQQPIVFITGFSKDRGFEKSFLRSGTVVEIPRLVHHPFTAKSARRRIIAAINSVPAPVLFGANTDHFALWAAELKSEALTIHLIHAFLHQSEGNRKHKEWLPLFPRMHRYVFIADQARMEFERFLLANNVPRSGFAKLTTIGNAVHGFGSVEEHVTPGVLFVGRDAPEKRLHLFLRIADALHAAMPGHVRFTVMGADPRPGHAHVSFTGLVTDNAARDRIYAAHDVLVVTSSREGFPMAIMEGMAQGLAIVATPVGDIPKRSDDRFAFVTSGVDEELVVREMVTMLTSLLRDAEWRNGMRGAALAQARTEFGMERFRSCYRELLLGDEARK